MGNMVLHREDERRIDEGGELLSVPVPLSFVWLVLAVLIILEAVNDLFGVDGPLWLYDNWVHNAILAVCRARRMFALCNGQCPCRVVGCLY